MAAKKAVPRETLSLKEQTRRALLLDRFVHAALARFHLAETVFHLGDDAAPEMQALLDGKVFKDYLALLSKVRALMGIDSKGY